jgi:hypothetical protein
MVDAGLQVILLRDDLGQETELESRSGQLAAQACFAQMSLGDRQGDRLVTSGVQLVSHPGEHAHPRLRVDRPLSRGDGHCLLEGHRHFQAGGVSKIGLVVGHTRAPCVA